MRWFDRKFEFDELQVSGYAGVVDRLRSAPARLRALIGSLPPEILTRKSGDQWSVQEHAGHLLDLSELDISRLDDYETGAKNLRPADLQNRKTNDAAHNTNTVENILRAFEAERAKFVGKLEKYDERFIQRSAIHPRLQVPMRVIDFAFFMSEHDQHHMSSIAGLIGKSA